MSVLEEETGKSLRVTWRKAEKTLLGLVSSCTGTFSYTSLLPANSDAVSNSVNSTPFATYFACLRGCNKLSFRLVLLQNPWSDYPGARLLR